MKTIQVKKLASDATLPTRANSHDAGMDLYASEDVEYKPNDLIVVPTKISVGIAPGYVGLVRDRSSVSKSKLKVTAGVVDAGYTGEVMVVMLNLSGQHGSIRRGQKFAQMLIIPVVTPEVVEVLHLGQTERGDKGFGSSG